MNGQLRKWCEIRRAKKEFANDGCSSHRSNPRRGQHTLDKTLRGVLEL
jgi:hypothetical protein